MSKRRRWLLGIALALLAAVVLVWSVLTPGGRMGVKVVFIGYTNGIIARTSISSGSGSVPSTLPLAVLMVTNTGSVPVKILPDIRVDTRTNIGEFALPLCVGSAGSLRPGEAVFFQALILDTTQQRPWWTELAYCRYGLRMRVHDKLWNTGNSVAQKLMNHLSTAPEKHWAQSGWISDPPTLFAIPGFHRTIISRTKATITIKEPVRWGPDGRSMEGRPIPLKVSDFIDPSRQRSRYHITAPPDWKDVDFSDLAPRSRL